MDRASAIDELPEANAVAIRLHDAGHDDQAIATALGIELQAVKPLLRIAAAKLSALMTERNDPPTRDRATARSD